MASLVGCLGSPSYWTRLTGTKEEQKVDQGASRWEMAPRNSGSEFFKSKYEKLLGYIGSLEVQEIIDRILRKYLKNNGENENACGFRPTAPADSLLSWYDEVQVPTVLTRGFSLVPSLRCRLRERLRCHGEADQGFLPGPFVEVATRTSRHRLSTSDQGFLPGPFVEVRGRAHSLVPVPG